MKENKVRTKKYFAPQNEGKFHPCDFKGCSKKGEYRAPKDKTLKEYYWFCLEHVAEYNAKWNYYENEKEQEDEPLNRKMHFGGFSSKIKYQFGYDFLSELGDYFTFDDKRPYLTAYDKQCAETLGIQITDLSFETLKKQYKKLARQYHPDMNAGDKTCEEKFKKITTAYHSLALKFKQS